MAGHERTFYLSVNTTSALNIHKIHSLKSTNRKESEMMNTKMLLRTTFRCSSMAVSHIISLIYASLIADSKTHVREKNFNTVYNEHGNDIKYFGV